MASRPQLSGEVQSDEVTRLLREIKGLEQELADSRDAESAARQASKDAVQAVRALRKQLQPFYDAMRILFGEIDRVSADSIAEDSNGHSSSPRSSAVWESWIQRLGGKKAQFIRAMLDHGHPMTSEQLRVATHTGRSTVPQIIHQLNVLGLINKNSGRFSLKEL